MGCCTSSDNRPQDNSETKQPLQPSQKIWNDSEYQKAQDSEKKTQTDISNYNNNYGSQHALAAQNNNKMAQNQNKSFLSDNDESEDENSQKIIQEQLFVQKGNEYFSYQRDKQGYTLQYQCNVNNSKFEDNEEQFDEDDNRGEDEDSSNNGYNVNNISIIRTINYTSNSQKTKLNQFYYLINLNFEKAQVQLITQQVQSQGGIISQKIQYYQQFNYYRQYRYFQQKETQFSIKSKQQKKSDDVENQMKQIVQVNNYNLAKCSNEIVLLALKQYFQFVGSNLLFQKSKKNDNNNVFDDDDDDDDDDDEDQEQEEDGDDKYNNYFDIQQHFVTTGFTPNAYYSLEINKTQIGWSYEEIEKNRPKFRNFLIQEIKKKYTDLKDDDIFILEVNKKAVYFTCPFELEKNQIGNKIFDKITKKYIINDLKLSEEYFDPKYNQQWNDNNVKAFRGNINGEKYQYHLPCGYYGLGLKVLGKYDNDLWLKQDTSNDTWIPLFHSTQPQFAQNILDKGFLVKSDSRQRYENNDCRFGRGKVGRGTYFSNKIQNCESYGTPIQILEKKFYLIFQCRVNPKTVRSPRDMQEYFVSQDPKDIRPYRILIKQKN
ncbi:hypothetical protein ABPG74_004101 [Tetrahymena malaccensis]